MLEPTFSESSLAVAFLDSVAFGACFHRTQDYEASLQDVGRGMDTVGW